MSSFVLSSNYVKKLCTD